MKKSNKLITILVASAAILSIIIYILLPIIFNAKWIENKVTKEIGDKANGSGKLEIYDWDFWNGRITIVDADFNGKTDTRDWILRFDEAKLDIQIFHSITSKELEISELIIEKPYINIIEHTPSLEMDESPKQPIEFNNIIESELLSINDASLYFKASHTEKDLEIFVKNFNYQDVYVSILNPVSLLFGSEVSGDFYLGEKESALKGKIRKPSLLALEITNVDLGYLSQRFPQDAPVRLEAGIAHLVATPYLPESTFDKNNSKMSLSELYGRLEDYQVTYTFTIEQLEGLEEKDKLIINSIHGLADNDENIFEKEVILNRDEIIAYGIIYTLYSAYYRIYPERIVEDFNKLRGLGSDDKVDSIKERLKFFSNDEDS